MINMLLALAVFHSAYAQENSSVEVSPTVLQESESERTRKALDALSWIYRRLNRIDIQTWVNRAKETGRNQYMGYAVFSASGALLYQSDLAGQVRRADLKWGWNNLTRNYGAQVFPFHVEYIPQLNRVSVNVSLLSARQLNAANREGKLQDYPILNGIEQVDFMSFIYDDRVENSRLRSMVVKVFDPTFGAEFPVNGRRDRILYFRTNLNLGFHRTTFWDDQGRANVIGSGKKYYLYDPEYPEVENSYYKYRVERRDFNFPDVDMRWNTGRLSLIENKNAAGVGFQFGTGSELGTKMKWGRNTVTIAAGLQFELETGGGVNELTSAKLRNVIEEFNKQAEMVDSERLQYRDQLLQYQNELDQWNLEKELFEFNNGVSTLSEAAYLQVSGASPKPEKPTVEYMQPRSISEISNGDLESSENGYIWFKNKDSFRYKRLFLQTNLQLDWERRISKPSASQPVQFGLGTRINLPLLHQIKFGGIETDLRRFQNNLFQVRAFIKF